MNEREIQEIQKVVDTYNFKAQFFQDLICIQSSFDEWVIELKCNAVILKHQSLKRNRTRKFREHKQKTFKDGTVTDALKAIKKHDNYTIKHKYNGHSRIWQKLKEISNLV